MTDGAARRTGWETTTDTMLWILFDQRVLDVAIDRLVAASANKRPPREEPGMAPMRREIRRRVLARREGCHA